MGKEVKISTMDGSGNFSAYMSLPETEMKAPAVIIIQEIFGVNKVMRDICDNLSQAGYITICPDLFWRQEPNIQLTDKSEAEWKRAFELFNGFDLNRGIEDLKATLSYMRRNNACSGKVGTLGYCLGGKLAYLMATRSNADCNVSYYGVGLERMMEEAGNIRAPLLMHIAEKDKFVPPEAQAVIMTGIKNNRRVQAYLYQGVDHAFARVGGEHYNREAAALANGRTAEFLSDNLANSP